MSHTNPLPSLPDVQAFQNTDREVWRETPGDFYSNSVHLTATGGLGINVGGTVYVKPPAEWHRLASGARSTALVALAPEVDDALREVGKWLNEQPNRPIDRVAVAVLCAALSCSTAAQPARLTIDELARTAYLVFCDAQDDSGWESLNDGERQSFTRVAEALNGTIAEMGSAAAQPVEPTQFSDAQIRAIETKYGFNVAEALKAERAAKPAASGDSAPPSASVQGDSTERSGYRPEAVDRERGAR